MMPLIHPPKKGQPGHVRSISSVKQMKSYRQIWTSAGSSHGKMKSCTTYALSQPEIYTTPRDNACLKPRWTFPSDAVSYSSSEEGFSWAQCNVNHHAMLKFIQESKDQIIPNCPSGLTIIYSRPQFPHMLTLMLIIMLHQIHKYCYQLYCQ